MNKTYNNSLVKLTLCGVITFGCAAVSLHAVDPIPSPIVLDYNDVTLDGNVDRSASFTDDVIKTGRWAYAGQSQGLIKFDLSSFAGVAQNEIDQVTLTLTIGEEVRLSDLEYGIANVYRFGGLNSADSGVSIPWDAAATRETYDGTNVWPEWTDDAGSEDEIGEAVVASTRVEASLLKLDGEALVVKEVGDTVVFDVTEIVMDWLYRGAPNGGLLISVGGDEDRLFYGGKAGYWRKAGFYSSDLESATQSPLLEMSFIPEVSQYGLLMGSCAFMTLLVVRRRSNRA
ncbi:hypothetical protein [Thalassobacterium sedimentorum]|nr:hypothetical protein [Coraliomargarita sp. SDUM461004]